MQVRSDGARGQVQLLRDLPVLPALPVVQEDDLSLHFRQLGQRRRNSAASVTLSGVGALERAPGGTWSVSLSDSRRIRFFDRFRTIVINQPANFSGLRHSSNRDSATMNDS